MFYAHFVLTKKGPLARIWLAAHWDKKLTKAHVFETNIDSSVEAIMKPKVKLALRTSGHLLLGVVRIYSRKAKYLLADCNEAFVKIKMAFRPGVVDLPEDNREANVAAITLQENFHDFDALEDLHDLDMTAQFSTVNQSRPEEITMKEDLTTISFVGDDNFGDVDFDGRELLRDANFDEHYMKSPRVDLDVAPMHDHSSTLLAETSTAQPMDMMMTTTMMQTVLAVLLQMNSLDLIHGGNLFEDTPAVPEIPVATPAPVQKPPGVGERRKRKRKLIVDEQQGIPSETMKLQLSDTTDIVTTLDLAPPTKKLMHWKETGGFEKLFALPGNAIVSKSILKLFKRGSKTRAVEEVEDGERLELEAAEVMREEDRSATEKSKIGMSTIRPEISTIMEESLILDTSKRSRRSDRTIPEMPTPKSPRLSAAAPEPQDVSDIFGQSVLEPQMDMPEMPSLIQPHFEEDGPPSIAPFSSFGADVEGGDQMPETEEQEEQRWTKRTEQMQHTLDQGFRYTDELSFKDMGRKLNRKQVTSKFYTLLVLKKHKVVTVSQDEPFGDILIGKGPKFGISC
ncbi:RAD21-like protein [Mya arenaria]|uniref:RAD21-like protein n=1 Tax=Mya arenaria TaxID=6604 RepID=A0ABY7FB82_MYAAR|nr:RAD21-like protein [Mya arenaria]